MTSTRFLLSLAALPLASLAQAVVFMDQIGNDPADLPGNVFTSQRFQPGSQAFDIASIDDFTVVSPQTVRSVQAFVAGFGQAFSFANVQSWSVELYSSAQAAAGNLVGDIGHMELTSGFLLDLSYAPDVPHSALLSLPIEIQLPAAGTYFVGVIAMLDSTVGQVGVASSDFLSSPSGLNNALRANPGGGFGQGPLFAASIDGFGVNLAYRVSSTPVPEPATVLGIVAGIGCLLRRRRD